MPTAYRPMPIDLAVIPVAGRGTRLLPLTKSQPKEMLPVGRKPVVQFVVEELVRCGVNRLLFITGPGKTAIENHFDIDTELIESLRHSGKEDLLEELAFEREDVEYFYTRQRRQLGLGHAVLCARAMVDSKPFVVALGDSMIGLAAQSDIVRRMQELFQQASADAVIAFEEVAPRDVVHYGIAKPAESPAADGLPPGAFPLDDLVEKPTAAEAPSQLAVAARYVFSPKIFDLLAKTQPGKGGEIQLTDAIRALIRQGGKVLGIRLRDDEPRYDIGNFASYYQTFLEFALSDSQIGPNLRIRLRELLEEKRED